MTHGGAPSAPGCEVRPIPGFEGLYSVSRDGRVWSHPKVIGRRTHDGQWLTPGLNTSGYEVVTLSSAGAAPRKTMRVHRAVALAWVPNPLDLPVVNHKNGSKRDNRDENLEWCTQADNVVHGYRNGLNQTRSTVDVEAVQSALDAGEKGKHIASRMNLCQSTVSEIKNGKHRPNRPSSNHPGETSHAI